MGFNNNSAFAYRQNSFRSAEKSNEDKIKKPKAKTKTTTKTNGVSTLNIKSKDLVEIIKPERVAILNYLRKNKEVLLTDLIKHTKRSRMSINNDLKILAKYKLITTDEIVNPSHGTRKVISTPHKEKITIQTEI